MARYSDARIILPGIGIANCYSNGGPNTGLLTKWWSEYQTVTNYQVTGHLNNKPSHEWTNAHDLNTTPALLAIQIPIVLQVALVTLIWFNLKFRLGVERRAEYHSPVS